VPLPGVSLRILRGIGQDQVLAGKCQARRRLSNASTGPSGGVTIDWTYPNIRWHGGTGGGMSFRKRADRFHRAGSRAPRRGEAGALTFSGILLLVVVVAILFCAFKLLPPFIDNYQLEDSMKNIARNATYNRMTEDDIRKEVMTQVRILGIPIEPSTLKVDRAGPTVNISVQYTVRVDLLARQVDLQFAPSAGNRNIMVKPGS
jgi:hypothetical protein